MHANDLLKLALVLAAFAPGAVATVIQPSEPYPPQSAEPAPPEVAPTDQPAESVEESAVAGPPMSDTDDTPLGEQPAQDPMPPVGTEPEEGFVLPGVALKRKFDKLAEETNLRIGIANTLLFQQATGGPGLRSAAGGDLDVMARWTAVGAGTKDTGLLVFTGEYRYQIGDLVPASLGPEIGTLIPTTNGFSERPPVVKEFYWDQRFFEDRFRFGVGRIDPENLFGGHKLQSANTFFLYKAFSSNPTVAYPGPGPAAAARVNPVPWLYVGGGLADANGKATISDLEGFFTNDEFFTFGEAGLTPDIEGVGTGKYRVAFWHIDAREGAGKPPDQGFTISCDQDIGESIIVFARYGHADGDVANVTDSVQGGAGFKSVFVKDDMLGVAAAWSRPFNGGLRDEKTFEVFQRFQVTETVQFTLDAEVIFDPSNAPGDDVLGVFSARLRFSF